MALLQSQRGKCSSYDQIICFSALFSQHAYQVVEPPNEATAERALILLKSCLPKNESPHYSMNTFARPPQYSIVLIQWEYGLLGTGGGGRGRGGAGHYEGDGL